MQKGAQEKRQLFSISIKGNLKTENYFNNKKEEEENYSNRIQFQMFIDLFSLLKSVTI